MLVYTPFALCFVTLHDIFTHFPELTYERDATVPVPYFLLFLCFIKATQEIFSELDKKAEPPIFPKASRSPKMRQRGARGWPHPTAAQPRPWPCHQGWGRLVHLLTPSPRREKPKRPINFLWNILQAAIVVGARSGGSRSSSRHPAGEENHHRRPSPPPWSPPEWYVSSLPWTTGP
jgi:hypothetical protein